MKYFILPLLFLLFALLPASAENSDRLPVRKIEANPINVAVMLTEQPDSAAIAASLNYYGYQPASDNVSLKTQDSRLKTEYKHPNGSTIRYTFNKERDGKFYSIIEVRFGVSQKHKEEILRNLNFKKNGNVYERRSIDHQTQCSSASQGYLRLSTHPKEKK